MESFLRSKTLKYITYSHRFADIILNSDYSIKQELESVIQAINFNDLSRRYQEDNKQLKANGKKEKIGMQASLNSIFREKFLEKEWEKEKNVFNNKDNDLVIDFWKRKVGVDVAFNHRSFIGGDLLRLQAAGEVKNVINVGIYICAIKDFIKIISPKDAASMVNFERVKWYLENFYPVLTVPIWLIGLSE
jgi:hypothetical protein